MFYKKFTNVLFCGRDEELSELHDLVKKKSKVMNLSVLIFRNILPNMPISDITTTIPLRLIHFVPEIFGKSSVK